MAMETERKISIAKAIIEKAIEVSDKTKHDVFVDWAPHVQWVEVDIYLGGWKTGKMTTRNSQFRSIGTRKTYSRHAWRA